MPLSQDRQGGRGDNLLGRLYRAKSSLSGALSCRSGGDYISPSPRGHGQKKRQKARAEGDYEKIPVDIKARQKTPVESKRLSLEGLALEYRREGHSKRTEKDSPTLRGKTNAQLQPTSQQRQDEFSPPVENVETLERDAANIHVGLSNSGEGKEKVDAESQTGHFQRDLLRGGDHDEIVEVMDGNETSVSAPEKDSRLTDPLATGSSKHIDFGQNAGPMSAKDGFENLDRPPYFHRAFSSNSEIEEVEVSTLKKDSEMLREGEDRKADEENREHHSVDGLPEQTLELGGERAESPRDPCSESEESSVAGKAGQNIVIPNSGRSYCLQDRESEKVQTLEQHESPVSVLSGALGSGRWAVLDSANNTPHPHADKSKDEVEELNSCSHDREADVAELGSDVGVPHPDSDNLRQIEDKSSKTVEVNDFATTNSHATGKDAIQEGMGSSARDYPVISSHKGELKHTQQDISGKEFESGDLKPEGSECLEQASQDGSEHPSQNLKEKSLLGEMDQMIQNIPQDDHGSEGREGPPSDDDQQAQNSDSLQKAESEKIQDGLHEKQISDGDDVQAHHKEDSPKDQGSEELRTGVHSKTPANDVNHDGTRDLYGGSANLYEITAAGKDDRPSLYEAGEDRSSHLYAAHSDNSGLQDISVGEKTAQFAHAEEHPAWKVGFISVPHVLVVGALTVLTVLGKAASS